MEATEPSRMVDGALRSAVWQNGTETEESEDDGKQNEIMIIYCTNPSAYIFLYLL